MTLRWRLTLLYTSLMAALLAVIGLTVFASLGTLLQTTARSDLDSNMRRLETLLQENPARTVDWTGFPPTVYGSIESIASLGPIDNPLQGARIAQDHSPNLVNSDFTQSVISLPDQAYRTLARNLEVYLPSSTLELSRRQVAVATLAVYLPSVIIQVADFQKQTQMILYLAEDLTQRNGTLLALRNILIIFSLIGVLLAGVGSFWLAGRALTPLRAVRKAAGEVSESDLSRRVPEPGTNDEVDQLAKTLNVMLDRIQSSFEGQRRFTADASHELRTPITAIAGHASYLLRRSSPTDQQRESLEVIRSESARLSKLVGDLLELARADAGMRLEPAEVDLLALAEDVRREVAPISGETRLAVEGRAGVVIMADAHRLRQVILNLVQNAMKAGAKLVTARVGFAGHGKAFLVIEDNGPGIPPEHLARIFERFYRVDTARNRELGGSGLGLSIVQRIVEAHHGEISVESHVGEGTRFEVRLPVGNPSPADDDLA